VEPGTGEEWKGRDRIVSRLRSAAETPFHELKISTIVFSNFSGLTKFRGEARYDKEFFAFQTGLSTDFIPVFWIHSPCIEVPPDQPNQIL
jgi:hypothetical protein